MKIELEVFKDDTFQERKKMTLERVKGWDNKVILDGYCSDVLIDIDELISALQALRKPLLASSND